MIKKAIILLIGLFFFSISAIIFCYLWVEYASKPYLYDDEEKMPKQPVAVVLGTSKFVSKGRVNLFYRTRIEAAAKLYHAGKVRYFIVSGANPSANYNEPQEMRRDLIAAGVPAENIQPDYAGLRTLDSVMRADKVFGNQKFVIVSQPFHNARAIFLARHRGLEAIAFNARDPVAFKYSVKTRLREFGARVKAVIDLFFTNKQAKFYGDKIPFPPKQE
ncbi:SanA/YdcF family protein [Suttonella ornithocola]|uniref:Vancomycin high temperature exclusion protein n=1 Tax=Suttonella ornithocola TaxID=279832 RepID=A0A380MPL9_9GAMM|nr:ElyC/SanA/YdcF family protein [Suttonella ornithocola]SUO93661.1 vancomycin high temperature exclusion protein [Suttonella ornithocola]